ncbi:MAG: DUF547 domain-containing protein [Inquilinus sp.]|nr:DUF547 domain-containing protein [Inquilinus sp.]
MQRRVLLATIAALPLAATARPVAAAPPARLWDRWLEHSPGSTTAVDHTVWDDLLARYLIARPDGINRFGYGAVTDADRDALARYVDTLSATDPDGLARDAQFALWVNLYNALTIKVVLDHFPVDSIRDIDISPGLFANGPWGAKLLSIKGETLALDDIEHRILRPVWRDPRIHYAVNCAALGCPNLAPVAFRPDRTEALLGQGAAAFVNHPRGARIERGRLRVSSIYVWFREDFGGSDSGIIAHLRGHATANKQAELAAIGDIAGHDYDWRLNRIDNGSR